MPLVALIPNKTLRDNDLTCLRLEFYLNIYFAIVPVHPFPLGDLAVLYPLSRCYLMISSLTLMEWTHFVDISVTRDPC